MKMRNKGFVDILMMGAVFVLLMYVFIQIFNPFVNILSPVAESMENGATTMVLIYLIPVVLVGMFLWYIVVRFKASMQSF
jgi:hypothetical protein